MDHIFNGGNRRRGWKERSPQWRRWDNVDSVTHYVCEACGVQFGESEGPPSSCPICEDARQYLPPGGQRWTTLEELQTGHEITIRDDAGLTGLSAKPKFAIGQRALLVPHAGRNVMWDCQSLITDDAVDAVASRGGLSAIAISHPHYYTTMQDWRAPSMFPSICMPAIANGSCGRIPV